MSKNSSDERPPVKMPELDPDIVNVAFSQEELATFTNLMSIVSQTFENLAKQAAEQNDENSFAVLAARQKLSSFYAKRLLESYRIGEPISRDVH